MSIIINVDSESLAADAYLCETFQQNNHVYLDMPKSCVHNEPQHKSSPFKFTSFVKHVLEDAFKKLEFRFDKDSLVVLNLSENGVCQSCALQLAAMIVSSRFVWDFCRDMLLGRPASVPLLTMCSSLMVSILHYPSVARFFLQSSDTASIVQTFFFMMCRRQCDVRSTVDPCMGFSLTYLLCRFAH